MTGGKHCRRQPPCRHQIELTSSAHNSMGRCMHLGASQRDIGLAHDSSPASKLRGNAEAPETPGVAWGSLGERPAWGAAAGGGPHWSAGGYAPAVRSRASQLGQTIQQLSVSRLNAAGLEAPKTLPQVLAVLSRWTGTWTWILYQSPAAPGVHAPSTAQAWTVQPSSRSYTRPPSKHGPASRQAVSALRPDWPTRNGPLFGTLSTVDGPDKTWDTASSSPSVGPAVVTVS